MVTSRRWVLAAGGAAVLLALWAWGGGEGGGIPLPGRRTPPPLPGPLPRIGLDRIGARRPAATIGRRDVFAYGPVAPREASPPVSAPAPARPQPAGTPAPVAPRAVAGAGALPSLNVSFIGVVEAPGGVKVAVLEAEGRDVLTGREGDLVANRLEIVKIGLESLDVRDVGSDRVRRLPLEGSR